MVDIRNNYCNSFKIILLYNQFVLPQPRLWFLPCLFDVDPDKSLSFHFSTFSVICFGSTRLYMLCQCKLKSKKWQIAWESENLKWWKCWQASKWYQGVNHTNACTRSKTQPCMLTLNILRQADWEPLHLYLRSVRLSCRPLNLCAVSKIGACWRSTAFLLSWLSDDFCLCWQVVSDNTA